MQQIQKFKKTELGEIPIEWNIYKGDEIFVISSGVSPTDVLFENNGDADTLYVKVDDMNLPINSKYIRDSKLKFRYKHNSKIPVADTNSIIFPKRGAAILTNKVRIVRKRCTVDPNVMVLSCKGPLLADFMYYHLVNFKLFNIMENAGLPQLNNKDLYPKKFIIPPFKEQQKIASILSSIDELIQKTDQIIEQTQRLKKGLMQRLLTKGIGHTKFKKTKLGEIPEEWNILSLYDVCKNITDGKHGDCENEHDSGYYFISAKDIFGGKVHYENARQITKSDFLDAHKRTKLESGDILLTNSGSIGKLAIVENVYFTTKTTFQKSVAILKPDIDKISVNFIYYYLDYNQKQLETIASGSSQKNLLLRQLASFRIVLPSISEQQKIGSVLSNVDELIQGHQKNKSSLEILKKGLMQQLLSGKIRVKV